MHLIDKAWMLRVKSFVISTATMLGGVLLTAVFSFLTSADFAELVTSTWGTGTLVSMSIFIVVDNVVKHLRNLKTIKDLEGQFGGDAVPLERVDLV